MFVAMDVKNSFQKNKCEIASAALLAFTAKSATKNIGLSIKSIVKRTVDIDQEIAASKAVTTASHTNEDIERKNNNDLSV